MKGGVIMSQVYEKKNRVLDIYNSERNKEKVYLYINFLKNIMFHQKVFQEILMKLKTFWLNIVIQ